MPRTPTPVRLGLEFSQDDVAGLLCCAFEGGSNYWAHVVDVEYPLGLNAKDVRELCEGKWSPAQMLPMWYGGTLLIEAEDHPSEEEDGLWRLNRKGIERALILMLEKHPKHFADTISENTDANTGDNFLQLCLFGEEILA